MLGKKMPTKKIDESLARSVNFELTVADLARRSERRAWWVAGSAIVMALTLAGGYFYMLPLKEKVPYLVMADAYTGTSTVARLTLDSTQRLITTNEAINRSNVSHFVLARESYDVALMNLRDWTTVLTMSAPGVAAAYTGLYTANNPDNPYKLYGRNKAIRVKLLSTVLVGGNAQAPTGATVRFQRTLYDKVTGASQPLDSEIATLAFTYKPNLKMADQYRIENPLGFQVTSYRVDDDYSTAPPVEIPATSGSTAAQGDQAPNVDASTGAAEPAMQPSTLTAPPIPEHDVSPANESPTSPPRQTAPGNATQGASRR